MANNNNAAPPAVKPEEEEIDESDLDKIWGELSGSFDDIIETLDGMGKRTFFDASNYKARQKLSKEDPGKKEFRAVITSMRKLKKAAEKKYKSQRPTKPRATSDKTKTAGFNRLVKLSPQLTKFMNCTDWGLVSEVDPTRGVTSHGHVTRYLANYVELMHCHNKGESSSWKANAVLLELFKDEWERTGVNPNAVKYTDVQKLLKYHMETIKEGAHERRNETEYRKKLSDETGEYGKPSKDILDHRKKLRELAAKIKKQNENLVSCRSRRQSQAITKTYEDALRASLKEFDETAVQVRAICQKNNFPMSPDYPVRPSTTNLA
jgi:hypothetical protein